MQYSPQRWLLGMWELPRTERNSNSAAKPIMNLIFQYSRFFKFPQSTIPSVHKCTCLQIRNLQEEMKLAGKCPIVSKLFFIPEFYSCNRDVRDVIVACWKLIFLRIAASVSRTPQRLSVEFAAGHASTFSILDLLMYSAFPVIFNCGTIYDVDRFLQAMRYDDRLIPKEQQR